MDWENKRWLPGPGVGDFSLSLSFLCVCVYGVVFRLLLCNFGAKGPVFYGAHSRGPAGNGPAPLVPHSRGAGNGPIVNHFMAFSNEQFTLLQLIQCCSFRFVKWHQLLPRALSEWLFKESSNRCSRSRHPPPRPPPTAPLLQSIPVSSLHHNAPCTVHI